MQKQRPSMGFFSTEPLEPIRVLSNGGLSTQRNAEVVMAEGATTGIVGAEERLI